MSRTDFYDFLNVYEQKELIIRSRRGVIELVKKPSFWERRAERKQLEGWEGRLRDLRGLRVYLHYRAESAYGEFFKTWLDEVDKEIGMLEKLIGSTKRVGKPFRNTFI